MRRMAHVRRLGSGLAAVALLCLSGCGASNPQASPTPTASSAVPTASAAPSRSASPPPVAGEACANQMAGARPVRFGPPSAVYGGVPSLGGVVLGSSKRGVLLAHERRGNLCVWATYAAQLATAGYRVLAIDLPGSGSSQYAGQIGLDDAVLAGTQLLRDQGATSVVLVGASMGGTAVLTAAVKAKPPVNGVVSVSGAGVFSGLDAVAQVARLTVPVLYTSCRADAEFAADAERMYAATPAGPGRQIVIDECTRHGVPTLSDSTKIRSAVQAFLTKYGGAGS